jgi:hypothetical protein
MKCPQCRALVDEGEERCTFCGHYLRGSMMESYKLDDYDPTAGYNPKPKLPQISTEEPKSKFRFKLKRG